MARNDPTIYMRIPQSLKDALDAAALRNKRSLTAEVVARLEKSLAQGDQQRLEFASVLNRLLDAENLQITDQGVTLTLKIDVEPAKES